MKQKIINLIKALIISITVFGTYDDLNLNFDIPKIILLIIIFLGIIIYYYLLKKLYVKPNKKEKVYLILFIVCTIFGKLLEETKTLFSLKNPTMLIYFLITIIGYYFYFDIMYNFFVYLLKKFDIYKFKKRKFDKKFNKKPFLISFLLVFASLIIYFIVFYPTTINTDPMLQLSQYVYSVMGHTVHIQAYEFILDLSNHYPIVHTMILGLCLRFGRLVLNDNFGLFSYIFVQGIFFALTCARSIVFFKKRGIKNRYLYLMILIYMTCPMYGFYIMDLNKDVMYSIVMMNLVMNIFNYLEDHQFSFKRFISWLILLVALALLRNNGIYITILVIPFVFFFDKKKFKYLIPLFIIVVGGYFTFTKILLPKWGVIPTTLNEALSVPFQQTARNIKYNEDDISESDKKVIDKVLDYDFIKLKYNPVLSDPVKNTFNELATKEDLINYFKVWFKEGLQNPITYIDATLNNMYGYYYIYSKPEYHFYCEYPAYMYLVYDIDFHFTSPLITRQILNGYSNMYRYFPFISMLISIGFNNLMLISLGIYLIQKKHKKYLIGLLPLYITYLVCDVSPVNTYFRYALPCMFLAPFIMVMFIYIKNLKKSH